MSKPACSNPSDNPPAPENRSTATGRRRPGRSGFFAGKICPLEHSAPGTLASVSIDAGVVDRLFATTGKTALKRERIGSLTDTRTPQQRRRIMSSVRQRDTGPELVLRRLLYASGVRGWRCNYRNAQGRPDLAWPALKVAVFVDGAFWHGHPSRHRPGRSGKYWDEKIARNVARDREVDSDLTGEGWSVLRLWDFDLRREPEVTANRVVDVLRQKILERGSSANWQRLLV
jgi:DNA mismatch endonuclease (patch repair protein)